MGSSLVSLISPIYMMIMWDILTPAFHSSYTPATRAVLWEHTETNAHNCFEYFNELLCA